MFEIYNSGKLKIIISHDRIKTPGCTYCVSGLYLKVSDVYIPDPDSNKCKICVKGLREMVEANTEDRKDITQILFTNLLRSGGV